MPRQRETRRELPDGLRDLIINGVNDAFAGHPNLNTAFDKVKIQHSNIADYQVNCRGIASYLGMQDQLMEVANKIKENILMPNPLIQNIEVENGFLNISPMIQDHKDVPAKSKQMSVNKISTFCQKKVHFTQV